MIRIASMLASGTEIVCALGLEDSLVAISHECDYPAGVMDRPRASRSRFDPGGMTSLEIDEAVRRTMLEFGSPYEIDLGVLADVRPDIILTQAVCEVCAVPTPGVEQAVAESGLEARVLSLDPHDIPGILGSVRQVADACEEAGHAGAAASAHQAVAGMEARLAAVRQAVEGADRPLVLGLEWLDPPFLPGHWVPGMIDLAGGRCAAGPSRKPSPQVGWEEVRGLDPDTLIVMSCGFGVERTLEDAEAASHHLVRAAPRAIRQGRSWAVDGSSYFNRSGPRVVDGVEILAGILHPDRWPAPAPGVAQVWTPELQRVGAAK